MKKVFYILLVILFLALTREARAKIIIRDTEIENYLHEYSEGIFRSAGLNPNDINIILIQDESPNAFVAGGMNIFIHTGLIELCDTPEELIGVIAHETGHISGGHLARLGNEMQSTRMNAIYALLLATVVGVGTGDAGAGAAVFQGGAETVKRNLLHYSRTQESVADNSAYKYLDRNNISSDGFLSFLEKLEKQSLLPSSSQAEYLSTHPLSVNRINSAREHVKETKNKKFPRLDTIKFLAIKEKIKGFIHPRRVIKNYKDRNDFSSRYAKTIANYRIKETKLALEILEKLIKENKNNPYLYELKGQILRENGDLYSAIKAYAIANDLLPNAPLIKVEYARSMLDTGEEKYLDTVVKNLTQAINKEAKSAVSWQLLAIAYKRLNNEAMFRMCQAESDFLSYDLPKAEYNAQKALNLFKKQKKACQRCEDIVDSITKAKKSEGEN